MFTWTGPDGGPVHTITINDFKVATFPERDEGLRYMAAIAKQFGVPTMTELNFDDLEMIEYHVPKRA